VEELGESLKFSSVPIWVWGVSGCHWFHKQLRWNCTCVRVPDAFVSHISSIFQPQLETALMHVIELTTSNSLSLRVGIIVGCL
jgi:hypothetical protein